MEHDTAMAWPEQLPDEALMAAGNEDDFSNFLEFGMDFTELEGHNVQQHPHQQQHQQAMQHANHHIATSLADDSRVAATTQEPQYQPMMGEHMAMGIPNNGTVAESGFHYPQEQQQVFHQQQLSQHPDKLVHQHHHHQQQQMAPHAYQEGQRIIPPTPNSVELHGGAARYMQRVDQGNDLYENYGQMSEEQAAGFYTPLVSPAMTPLETQFRLPEYTIPGEYFTPLTSPALEAQNPSSNGYPFTTQPRQNATYAPSPVDTNGLTMTSAPPSPALFKSKRQTRRPSTATRTGGRAAKASPSIQAKNWKKQNRNSHLLDDLSRINTTAQDQGSNRHPNSAQSSLRYGSNESSQDSVSPEPISEPLMPPPALPHKSPAIVPQMSEPSSSGTPATPATLMRITNRLQHTQHPSGHFSGQASLVSSEPQDETMEDIALPEAATDIRPRLSRVNTAIATNNHDKSLTNTPTMEPQSTSSRRPSGSLTPGLLPSSAMPSPSGPVPKKSESKSSTTTRKRQSVSSSHASPALRPRISPSIQPLVRGDAMTSESSALYLASKSNYQHILDGTVLPGVSYPETLAENLSSKRTNHKLAEQGRRNRINTALKEIEALLPPGFAQERAIKESKESPAGGATTTNGNGVVKNGEKEKNTPAAISKASTVEMAIDYIKALKQELDETKAKLKKVESRLSAVKDDSDGNADVDAGAKAGVVAGDKGVS